MQPTSLRLRLSHVRGIGDNQHPGYGLTRCPQGSAGFRASSPLSLEFFSCPFQPMKVFFFYAPTNSPCIEKYFQ